MKLEIPEFFLNDLQKFDSSVQTAVFEQLETLQEKGLSHPDVGLVSRDDMDIEAYRLKIKPGDDRIDHRVVFDIINSRAYLITIDHRDNIYETSAWTEIRKRLGNSETKD